MYLKHSPGDVSGGCGASGGALGLGRPVDMRKRKHYIHRFNLACFWSTQSGLGCFDVGLYSSSCCWHWVRDDAGCLWSECLSNIQLQTKPLTDSLVFDLIPLQCELILLLLSSASYSNKPSMLSIKHNDVNLMEQIWFCVGDTFFTAQGCKNHCSPKYSEDDKRF